jgi:hypothetical protein
MRICKILAISLVGAISLFAGCGKGGALGTPEIVPVALRDVAAERLGYRYEGDVPPPTPDQSKPASKFDRSEAVQMDFDTNRPTEILERTIASPGGERVLAVFRKGDDIVSDFRLDMYTKDGTLIRKITHDEMAVQFPDTLVWSPDGSNVAFVAKVRGSAALSSTTEPVTPGSTPEIVDLDGEKKADVSETEGTDGEKQEAKPPGVEASKDVITFRTEQIYICGADGSDVKPLTNVEGLMYFYFVWAPDSSALAALAAVHTEWKFFEKRAEEGGQFYIPRGRPRLIEKNGRERKLDDLATPVHPVWSPDSAKIAVAFDKQVRIYDGIRQQPTQAAIPLKNDLLISSRAYEKTIKTGENVDGNNNTADSANSETESENKNAEVPVAGQPESALPDANLLVSFNPIVNLVWPDDKTIYFETGFIRNYLDETKSVRSFMRWHRLLLSAQAIPLTAPQQTPQGQK